MNTSQYINIPRFNKDKEMGILYEKPKLYLASTPYWNYDQNKKNKKDQRKDLMENYLTKIFNKKDDFFNFNKLIFGFKNIGNSCYMNSALQVILRNPFRDLVNTIEKINCKEECKILNLFCGLIFMSTYDNNSDWSIEWLKFLKKEISKYFEKYGYYNQEDSVEFYLNFIRIILEEFSLSSGYIETKFIHLSCVEFQGAKYNYHINHFKCIYENRPDLPKYYKGLFLNELKCEECNYVSIDFEDFISIPLYTNYDRNPKINLMNLLDNFFNPEKFDQNIECFNCKEKSINRLHKSILVFPKIITLILNRINEMNNKDRRNISNEGSRTFSVNLTKYKHICTIDEISNTRNPKYYHLYGTLNHSGSSFGGHYVSHCYSDNGTGWIRYSDSRINKVDFEEVLYEATCLLLFEEIYKEIDNNPRTCSLL